MLAVLGKGATSFRLNRPRTAAGPTNCNPVCSAASASNSLRARRMACRTWAGSCFPCCLGAWERPCKPAQPSRSKRVRHLHTQLGRRFNSLATSVIEQPLRSMWIAVHLCSYQSRVVIVTHPFTQRIGESTTLPRCIDGSVVKVLHDLLMVQKLITSRCIDG